MQFNFDSSEPLYLQVAEQIENAIFLGSFATGEQIPSTTEISRDFQINPATVLKGMNILVADGLIQKKRGRGMFVLEDAQEKIRTKRKNEFFQDYILNMIVEAKNLGLDENAIISLVERGFEEG
ncbi:GntR family transcriptional regulator [Ligilactobacillus acidipiscis]|nr:GntR family transcriptional regulator [Ligilactobacillus acidipiscis]MCI1925329.1 GntR family transcriptional regulator [Ligilactobacillus acidipiscis]MCI1954161.1 GntR family transcriptional regulator [Ligilactobacillus acidipiscis]SFV39442.1 Transcriptional regulator, GntR family [Ligilactobacillus acidipiscis]GAW64884.1 GntR family transcriptional regulator [Ligilactobacillus acidipiscis]GEN20050.1 GntR family transcriptional regulator [Ligilactobacillus acidipiscis]